jgi:hypothetical protein
MRLRRERENAALTVRIGLFQNLVGKMVAELRAAADGGRDVGLSDFTGSRRGRRC